MRVLEAGYSGLLLGTDVFSEEGNGVLSQVSIARDGRDTLLTVEVSETDPNRQGPGIRVAVPLYRAEVSGVDAHVGAVNENERRDLGEVAASQMPKDVRKWCSEKGLSERMIDNAWEGLLTAVTAGLPL